MEQAGQAFINEQDATPLVDSTNNPKASLTIKICTIAVFSLLAAINCLYFLMPGHPMEVVPYAIGSLVTPLLVCTIVVLLFQIGKRFRTQRSRWKIVLWVTSFLLLTKLLHFAQVAAGFFERLGT